MNTRRDLRNPLVLMGLSIGFVLISWLLPLVDVTTVDAGTRLLEKIIGTIGAVGLMAGILWATARWGLRR